MAAEGVMLGRATLYGASATGDSGASRAHAIFKDELTRTMQFCSVPSTAAVNSSALF
jgi:(S)-mandelate dehydrogenase